MPVSRPPACSITTIRDDTVLQTWFERDRAHVCLSRKNRNNDAGDTIIEWWDGDVAQAAEDGFLNPPDYHATAHECGKNEGLFATWRTVDVSRVWPSLVIAFVRDTPASGRPHEQPDRIEWYFEIAECVTARRLPIRNFAIYLHVRPKPSPIPWFAPF